MNAIANAVDMKLARNSLYPIEMLVLSHSTRSAFRSCARKGMEFKHFFGRPGFREDNFAGEVGIALHRGFEAWLQTRDESKALLTMMLSYPYDDEFLRPENSGRSFEACYSTLLTMMRAEILATYEVAKIKTKDGEIRAATEVPFAIEITGAPLPIPVWFVGYIDCILYNTFQDTFRVVDLKTTRQFIQDMSLKYEYDEQVVPYGTILEHALGRKVVELDVAYLSVYIDLLDPKVNMYAFKKTPDHLTDWYRGLCEDIERIAQYYHDAWFPRATNGDTCMAFKRRCEFAEICSYRDPNVLARMIQGTPRTGLFSTGEEPWIVAELPFVGSGG